MKSFFSESCLTLSKFERYAFCIFSIKMIHSMRVHIWYTEANFSSVHNISLDIELEMDIANLSIKNKKNLRNLFEWIYLWEAPLSSFLKTSK